MPYIVINAQEGHTHAPFVFEAQSAYANRWFISMVIVYR
jgi:hypothetical protein